MRAFFYSALCLLALFFAASCGNQSKQESANAADEQPESPFSAAELAQQDSIWKDMMLIHDSVMPKTADINRLSQSIKKQLSENTKLNEILRNQMITALEYLEQSDASMFDWMNNLQQPGRLRETKQHPEIMAYMQQEKDAIAKISRDMLKSLELGEQVMGQVK